ncbi:MAG TPA: SpaH/EbpB family LPXTG-anchored major pilin, partial [Beutenbergiaceae bacterium]|nr:SpaH/EbpB family LPXTG-anchored major pilin [Beutenbergiaceae bacterium]
TSGQESTLVFTQDGLYALENVQGGTVVFNLSSTVSDIGSGTLVNDAAITINGTTVDVEAQTTWGALNILKHVADVEDEVLGGAQFQVFATEVDAQNLNSPISIDGVDTFTTDDTTGIAHLAGLFAAEGGTTYWIVETQAPVGYLANDTPIAVTVQSGSTAQAVQVDVPNTQAPSSTLPELGSAGMTTLAAIAGIALISGAALVVTGRRKADVVDAK